MKYALVSCLTYLGLSSCSQEQTSALSTVTSPRGDENVLYWQDKTDLVRGVCAPGLAVNRTNCATNLAKLPQADVLKRAMDMGKRGADLTATEISAEIKALKDADPTIASLTQQIAALTQQKSGVEAAVAATAAQLESDKKTKVQIEEQLVYDKEQLKAVESRLLSSPNDETLLALQRQLKIEILQYTETLDALIPRIQSNEQRLTAQKSILTKVATDIAAKQDELKKYAETLEVDSPKLQQLKADQALAQAKLVAVPKVIESIANADVMYRSKIWPADFQGAFTIIERAFGGLFLLTPGNYKVVSGYSSYCPQRVQITSDVKLKVDFLSPCTGGGALLTCNDNVCSAVGMPNVLIIDETHYEYSQENRSFPGVFLLEKPAL